MLFIHRQESVRKIARNGTHIQPPFFRYCGCISLYGDSTAPSSIFGILVFGLRIEVQVVLLGTPSASMS